MNLLLFDYNKAFLQVYDTFEEILKTNIISENVRPLDNANLIGHLNESFREYYLQNVYTNYTEFLIAYLAMIRSRPNKQILIKVCSDFILNWQKQVKKCTDLQLFLYCIQNNKDSKKLFEIYYYIRKTLFSYQTELYRNNPLDKLQYDFEEANRLFKSLFSADLCKGICQRFVALIQKHSKTVYKGNVMKGSFIAEFVLHEYLEIKEQSPELLKEVIIHNRLLVKEQNKYEFRKRFKINDSIIDYSPQQTGRNQGNKKFVLDLSMLDHKKLGIDVSTSAQPTQKEDKNQCIPQQCEHLQQIEFLQQRESQLVQENGELMQANKNMKNQLLESVIEVEFMKKAFDDMKSLTQSMMNNLQNQQGENNQKQITSDKANIIIQQFDQNYLSVSQKIQQQQQAKVTQKKQYKQLKLNNSTVGQDNNLLDEEQKKLLQAYDKQISNDHQVQDQQQQLQQNQQPQQNQQQQIRSVIKQCIKIPSEESFIKIKQTESTLTNQIPNTSRLQESYLIQGGGGGVIGGQKGNNYNNNNNDQYHERINESLRERSNETRMNNNSDFQKMSIQDSIIEESQQNYQNIQNYSIQVNGQIIQEQQQDVNQQSIQNQSPYFRNAPGNQIQQNSQINPLPKTIITFPNQKNEQSLFQSQSIQNNQNQNLSNQSSIEDIYIKEMEYSVGNKINPNEQNNLNNNNVNEINDSPIKQISLFKLRSASGNSNQESEQFKFKPDSNLDNQNMDTNSQGNKLVQQKKSNIKFNEQELRNNESQNNNNQYNQNNKPNSRLENYSLRSQTSKPIQSQNNETQINNDSNIIPVQIIQDNNIQQTNSLSNENQINQNNSQSNQRIKDESKHNSQNQGNIINYNQSQNNNTQSNIQQSQSLYKNSTKIDDKPYFDSKSNLQSNNILHQSVKQHQSIKQQTITHQEQSEISKQQDIFESQRQKSSSINSVGRQKFPTFDEGLSKIQIISIQDQNESDNQNNQNNNNNFSNHNNNEINYDSFKQNRNQSPSFNQDLFSQQPKQNQSQFQNQRDDQSSQSQENDIIPQTQNSSSNELNQQKSKNKMSGVLIESINLTDNQQNKLQFDQFNQNNNSKNMNNINIKRDSNQSQKVQNTIGMIQSQKNQMQYNNQNNLFVQQQDILDNQSIHESKAISDILFKQDNYDIPEEEEIGDENSENTPFQSKKNEDNNTNKSLKQQISQEYASSLKNSMKQSTQQNNNNNNSVQNIPNISNIINQNEDYRKNSIQSYTESERTPDHSNYIRRDQTQSQKIGQNHSHSPFRKSMYASYQVSSFKGIDSNQLLQYSPFSAQQNNSSSNSQIKQQKQQLNIRQSIPSQFQLQEENSNNLSTYNPNIDPSKFMQNSMQISKVVADQSLIASQNRSSISHSINNNNAQNKQMMNSENKQSNKQIQNQKRNEQQQNGLDLSQLSDNRSRNSQLFMQESNNNNIGYIPQQFNTGNNIIQRDISPNQRFPNVLQDIDSPMIANSSYQINNSASLSYSPYHQQKEYPTSFEGAVQRQVQQNIYNNGQRREEDIGSDDDYPDDVERQSDTWLRDSVIENNDDDSYINGYKRDSKNKSNGLAPFKYVSSSQIQDATPKPIFYGVPIKFQQTEIQRRI